MKSTHSPFGETTCTVYLVRHGRTVLNANGVLRGHLNPPLDTVGIAEAEALGREIAGFRPESILSSPLSRAVETANAIGYSCGLRPLIDDRLIDRDYGRWAGSSIESVIAEYGSVDSAPEVEPKVSVVERAIAVLGEVVGRKRVVIVAHEAVNTLLLATLSSGNSIVPESLRQPTGSYSVLQFRDGEWRISEMGVLPHS